MKKALLSLVVLITFLSVSKAQTFSIPYSDDFETGAPGWHSAGFTGSEWQLGTPNYGATASSHSGNKCWDVDIDSAYANNTNCFLDVPTLNFGNASGIKISFWINFKCESGWDGTTLLYRTDTLIPQWSIIGSFGASGSTNWYNTSNLNALGLPGWSGNSLGWQYCSVTVPNTFGSSDVYLRFRFGSDGSVTEDGFSIDDFMVEPVNINFISGTVFRDVNSNNIIDAGDTPMTNLVVNSQSGTNTDISITNNLGLYLFIADSASTNDITPTPPLYSNINPANLQVSFTGNNQVSTNNNFLVSFIPGIVDMRIEASLFGLRPFGNSTMFIHYNNQGTDTTSGTITLNYDTLISYVSSSDSSATLIGSNTIQFSYQQVAPGHYKTISVTFLNDTNMVLGTLAHLDAVIYPVIGDTIPTNNYDTLTVVAVNSCDPNSKEVEPEGEIMLASIQAGVQMDYVINFQNIGTAPAINVNIYDAIDEDLDLSTFELVGSSHPITNISIDANRMLHFTFANINLPDSTSDEPNSHGNIHYRINALTTLAPGNEISNTAIIYFDNNLPILTNTTNNLIIAPTSVNTPVQDERILIFPNPNNGELILKLPFYCSFEIYNESGQLILKQKYATAGLIPINLKDQPSGIYFIKVQDNAIQPITERFIIQR